MKRLRPKILVTIALTALVMSGSAAGALGPAGRQPSPPAGTPSPTAMPFVKALATPLPAAGRLPARRGNGHQIPEIVPGAFAAYGTGTPLYADALEAGGRRLADVEVAFSGASFSSNQMTEGLINEMQRVVSPALAGRSGFGRGSGLELGLGIGSSDKNQIILADLAESASPPSVAKVTKQIGPVDLDPLLQATLLRGQAASRVASSGCTIGSDLAYGLGYAADLNLLDLGGGKDFVKSLVKTSAEGPERSVSQSTSRTRLVPRPGTNGPDLRFGLLSETRQTIAPVTFFSGTDSQFTIEVLGEWVLRGRADGKDGSVFYGPADTSPETPILRILDRNQKVTTQLTFQNLLGKTGLDITIPGLAEIVVGEDPRAIGGDAKSSPTENGTLVLGAVDVVRVRLLAQPDAHLADVRLGHMEVGLAVPPEGIDCSGIGMTKRATPSRVKPGEKFDWIVTVSNPNDCRLSHVKLVDTIKATDGVRYEVVSSDPKAPTSASGVTFDDIGSLDPGQSKTVRILVKVADDSAKGRFTDEAVSSGLCGPAGAEGEATAGATADDLVPMEGRVKLDAPEVDPGIIRHITMVKKSDPTAVKVGDAFKWTLTVSNPNDCTLTKLKILDTIGATPGVKYEIVSTEPKADSIDDGTKLTFTDVGPLPPGQSKDVLIRMKVADRSSKGRFTNDAVARGQCGEAPAEGGTEGNSGVDLTPLYDGHVILDVPTVGEVTAAGIEEPARGNPALAIPDQVLGTTLQGQQLPRTGAALGVLWPMVILGTGTILRVLARRSRVRGRVI